MHGSSSMAAVALLLLLGWGCSESEEDRYRMLTPEEGTVCRLDTVTGEVGCAFSAAVFNLTDSEISERQHQGGWTVIPPGLETGRAP